jgi:hypothetical protein
MQRGKPTPDTADSQSGTGRHWLSPHQRTWVLLALSLFMPRMFVLGDWRLAGVRTNRLSISEAIWSIFAVSLLDAKRASCDTRTRRFHWRASYNIWKQSTHPLARYSVHGGIWRKELCRA